MPNLHDPNYSNEFLEDHQTMQNINLVDIKKTATL